MGRQTRRTWVRRRYERESVLLREAAAVRLFLTLQRFLDSGLGMRPKFQREKGKGKGKSEHKLLLLCYR